MLPPAAQHQPIVASRHRPPLRYAHPPCLHSHVAGAQCAERPCLAHAPPATAALAPSRARAASEADVPRPRVCPLHRRCSLPPPIGRATPLCCPLRYQPHGRLLQVVPILESRLQTRFHAQLSATSEVLPGCQAPSLCGDAACCSCRCPLALLLTPHQKHWLSTAETLGGGSSSGCKPAPNAARSLIVAHALSPVHVTQMLHCLLSPGVAWESREQPKAGARSSGPAGGRRLQSSSSSHRCPTFLSHPGRVMMSAKLGRPAASRAFDACLSCSCASSCRYLRVCSARHAPVKSKTEKTAASQCHDCCKSMPFSTHVPHMLHTCPHQSPPALTPRSTYQPITPSEYEPSTESEHRASSQHVQDLLVRFILPRACFLLCWRRQKHATAGHGGGLGQGGDQGER